MSRLEETINTDFANDLGENLRGRFLTDTLSKMLYSTDASSYQIEPLGVVIPTDVDDIVTTIKTAGQYGISVIPRGGGTSLSGQGIGKGIILDITPHLNQILEINVEDHWARVQAGVLLDQLNAAVRPHGLMVGPDPSSSAAATIGGMTANNSTGSHSIVYGMMVDHVLETEVVLSDGRIVNFKSQTDQEISDYAQQQTLVGNLFRGIPQLVEKYEGAIDVLYPKTWRNVAGYNINRILRDKREGKHLNLSPLIVGSEGTLAVILSVKVNLVKRPAHTHLVLLHYENLHNSLSAVHQILEHKPSAVELLDEFFLRLTRQNAEYRHRLDVIKGNPGAVLIVEFAGDDPGELRKQVDMLLAAVRKDGFTTEVVEQSEPAQIDNVWQVRKAGFGLMLSKRGDAKPLAFIDDAAVPVEHLADYADKVMKICEKAGTEAGFYAHVSAGCPHINPMINLKTENGLRQLRSISEAVIDLAINYGGTSTGEHGEGLARSYYNEKVYGPELHQAFKELKGIFDPKNIFNPGKIIDTPLPWDPQLLRFNAEYQTPLTIRETHLDFSEDGGFNGLVEMCNGQGSCRKTDNGVMCPSYMATRNEAYSTRGRANALRAAITGRLGQNGLDDPSVYETLDLCLGCKACKHECPSLVDMAKLKYEFLARYQEKNGIPLRSRIFGYISTMNKIGSHAPKLINGILNNGYFSLLLKRWFGIDQHRSLPLLAQETFQQWFYQRKNNGNGQNRVILWDDTFLSFNEPEIGIAAVKVLEAAGFNVEIVRARKCCGRPLISKGLLKQARSYAEHNVNLLLPYVEQGVPVVGIEPSCVATFRDEYVDLLKNDAARQVAKNCLFMEEFLSDIQEQEKPNLVWSDHPEARHILVHGHCHQKAIAGTGPLLKMLRMIPNSSVEEINSGCCGMAGSFGYEREHYEISMKCGEDRLFPAIRKADPRTRIAAAGTSCRHQIKDGTGFSAEHPIQLLAEALK
jgi:FAD/FMN-containing dehydrogenase/Fe-S oxidoreductase